MKNAQQRAMQLTKINLLIAVAFFVVVFIGAVGIYQIELMNHTSRAEILIFIFVIFIIGLYLYLYSVLKKFNKQIEQQEQKLKDTNIRLEYAISGSGDGLWDWNLVTNEVYFSPRWKEMLGYQDDELENALSAWEVSVHPDDLSAATEAILHAQSAPNVEYRNEHRLRHKEGHWVWILDRGQTIFDENNKPVRMVGFHTDITQQKQLQEELRASRELFIQFMQHIPAHVCIIEGNSVVYSNTLRNDTLKKELEKNNAIEELLPKEKVLYIYKALDNVAKNGIYEDVVRFKNEDGKEKIYREFAFSIGKGELGKIGMVSLDITSEYQSNEQIKKVLSAFDRSNISVVMTDLAGDITYVNPSWCKITGYSKEELLGQNPRIVKSGYVSHAKYKEMWNELTNGRVWISEIKNKAKDKTEFWEESTVMPSFDKDGFVDGYIAFKVEISEKMRLKEELQKQEEMMLVQSRHAAMGEMISMIAHQWRQPISVIAMDAANILVDVELEILDFEGLKEVSQNIINQTQELSKTIDDFRDFFKPNKVAEEITFEQIMHDTNAVLGKSLLNHSINFTQEIPNGIVLKTYDRELMQVLLNILKNAKEAFDDEKHYEKKIHLEVIPLGEKIQINISDNAGGIDEAILEKIFEPYFSTKELKNGTGLGLYICKTIVEKHLKGSIEVKNLQDGALFIIQIPCRIEND